MVISNNSWKKGNPKSMENTFGDKNARSTPAEAIKYPIGTP
jgi:hypothetical protein